MNSTSKTVEQFNHEIQSALVPNIYILGFYMVTGLIGNSFVIHIYRNKMRETTDSRFFIPSLAMADMLACVVCCSCAIYLSIRQVNFVDPIPCKAIWFSMTSFSSSAAMFLVFIAVARYLRICHTKLHTRLMAKKIIVLISVYGISFLISSPVIVISGITTLTKSNMTLSKCERISDQYYEQDSFNITLAYTIFEALVVVSIAMTMTLLYIQVGIKLYSHFKSAGRTLSVNSTQLQMVIEKARDSMASNDSNLSDKSPVDSRSSADNELKRNLTTKLNIELQQLQRRKEKFNRKHKYTYVFITISIVCIVTYTPRLVLMLIEMCNKHFWISMYENNRHNFSFLKFLNRSYIINNIANPLLYAMFDTKFRKELFNFLTCQ